MNIQITCDRGISQKEVESIVAEERKFYASRGKELAEIELKLENDEILIKSYERSPIKRIRRITGYLSEEHNFNTAKQAELHNRVQHCQTKCG